MEQINNILQTNPIAPCGINCGTCLVFLRDKNSCNGCWGPNDGKPRHCIQCSIKSCALLNQTEAKYCYACPKYPCTRLKQLDKRYRIKYKVSLINHLDAIQTYGLDKFVENEQERWRCHRCGGTICVHLGSCLRCAVNE